MNLIATLNGFLAHHHAMLSQKNILQWLQDGDINSGFFRRLHSTQKSRASINTVQVGDTFVTLESDIGHHVVNYYKKLFAKDELLSLDFAVLSNFDWPHVSPKQNMLLTATPFSEEIHEAISGLDPSSSPGPDGFGGFFYQKFWDVISDDVSNAIIFPFAPLSCRSV